LYKKQKALYYQTKLVLRIDGFMQKQSFSMQPPTNCHGSLPFPTYALRARYANALFTLQASSFVSSGQWLADIIIVAQTDYDYGKRQSISSSADPAKFGTS